MGAEIQKQNDRGAVSRGRWRRLFLALAMTAAVAGLAGCPPSDDGGDDGGGGPVTVNGTIRVPARAILDADTPNPDNPNPGGNDAEPGQAITLAGEVLGYAAVATDDDDYFQLSLKSGDEVWLRNANPLGDLDLFLLQAGVTKDSSQTANNLEIVTAPADGPYSVQVMAASGGSIYNLAVATSPIAAPRPAPLPAPPPKVSADAEFVLGQAIVQWKNPDRDQADLQRRAQAATAAAGAAIQVLGETGMSLVDLPLPAGQSRDALQAAGPLSPDYQAARRLTLETIARLNQDPEVKYAEPNFIRRHFETVPNDPSYKTMWNLTQLRLPMAWDVTTGSAAVVVAVIDTGVVYTHPDLAANILKNGPTVVGYDFISDLAIANDGNGVDPDPLDPGDRAPPEEQSSFHGTHVSGTIAAASNNATGVTGVSWQTKIMPVRVLGKGGGTDFDINQAILYAAGLTTSYGAAVPKPKVGGVVTPARIINLSLGGGSYSQSQQDAINQATSAGVIVVAAAGNSGVSAKSYPAALNHVTAVSAVDFNGAKTYYSNYGAWVDLAAPGGDGDQDANGDGAPDSIYSTWANDRSGAPVIGYAFMDGTSMASPHVAGVAALMLAANNALTPTDFENLIKGAHPDYHESITNYDLGVRDNKKGYGLIDADQAVRAAQSLAGAAPTNPDLALEPNLLDFGPDATTLSAAIVNRGPGTLDGLTVAAYAIPWVQSHLLGGATLAITINRAGLATNRYDGQITVSSTNGGDDVLSLRLQVGNVAPPVYPSVGAVYVLLVDIYTETAVAQVITNLDQDYQYSFIDVPVGDYILAAGTDTNNDLYIGDPGEALGVYPSNDQPELFSILFPGQVIANADFDLEFVDLPQAASTSPRAPRTFKRLPQ